MNPIINHWSLSEEELLQRLNSKSMGLDPAKAQGVLLEHGPNRLSESVQSSPIHLFFRQFKNNITIILLFATVVSLILGDYLDSLIIFSIIIASAVLSFFQEYNAGNATKKLMEVVEIKVTALRGNQPVELPVAEVVPGDIILLSSGNIIPADGRIVESNSLSIDESMLTGESFPVEKNVGILPEKVSLSDRTNSLWMGTHVISGSGRYLVVNTGVDTEFGRIANTLNITEPENDFEIGVRKFGTMLMEVTVFILLFVFIINLYLQKPPLDSLIFSLSLAVGLTPQLLPAIISINLSHGAKLMADKKVIVKKLSSIEDFGTMNLLCSDKTGTITTGNVVVQGCTDLSGQESEWALLASYINSSFQTGYVNPIDEAILAKASFDLSGYEKRGEIPYNFIDKRLGIVTTTPTTSLFKGETVLLVKGAVKKVLEVTSQYMDSSGEVSPIEGVKEQLEAQFASFSAKGYRTLAVAYAQTQEADPSEKDLTLMGLLTFVDPLKDGVIDTVSELREKGVELKVITGDNRLVAENIARQLSLEGSRVLTGEDLLKMNEPALIRSIEEVSVFAEIEPNQKERIILACKKAGNTVGYMGDGINDAAAIHAANVGISVNTAADVAKEAADIVLLENNLDVLSGGITYGRKTFSNTMKYVFMATSSNFGNMFSMAGASLMLPFLPLKPTQILLENLLTDFPEMQIAKDNVDENSLDRPTKWDLGFIRRFMVVFGLLSSIFDYATFGVLLLIFNANESLFQTGWFTESIISATCIVFVIRTRGPFYKSKPARGLVLATLLIIGAVFALPYTGLGSLLGLHPMPLAVILSLMGIVLLYVISGEIAKKFFYQQEENRRRSLSQTRKTQYKDV